MANYDLTYEGPEVQDILDAGNKLEADGYIFCGVATPSTNPGTPTEKVYYLAKEAGTYTNFNGAVLPTGIHLLMWNGSWSVSTIINSGGFLRANTYNSSSYNYPYILIKTLTITYPDNTIRDIVFDSDTPIDMTNYLYLVLRKVDGVDTLLPVATTPQLQPADILLLKFYPSGNNKTPIAIDGLLANEFIQRNTLTAQLGLSGWYDNSSHILHIQAITFYYNGLFYKYKGINVDYNFTDEYRALVYNVSTDSIYLKNNFTLDVFEFHLLVLSAALQPYGGLLYDDVQTFIIRNAGLLNTHTIHPLFRYGWIKKDGSFNSYGKLSLCTPRYIRVSTGQIAISVEKDCYISIRKYDSNYNIIRDDSTEEPVSVTAESGITYNISSNVAYIKLNILSDTTWSVNVPLQIISLQGTICREWDVFNERPSDSGYQRIIVHPNVTNPTCCDEETQQVQDSEDLLTDYGLIALPEQYKNTGEPTRMIIYCHGAAVNYSDGVTRFNSVDLEPDYWLAEGYAVMDVEGNPFNNTDEHICIPQTMDCYVAAYQWAIEHYNIRRDGIFLGGRSMGGENTFNLMRRECPIPVIAACPNSPAPDLSFGYSNKARKEFCALHMGFIVPDGFSWTDGYLTAEEKQVLKDNWDKYIKCCPELSACVDLPDKDTLLDNNVGEPVVALWSTLHMWAKCPVKLFGCNQDPSCVPRYTTSLLYRMLINSGQITECRLFNSYKDYSGTGTTAHHYDTQDPALRTTWTTRYGVVMQNVPIVYIEMLQFWRRYEQLN